MGVSEKVANARPGGYGETREEFQQRIHSALLHVEQTYAGKKVAIVTHRGAIRLLAPDCDPEHASPIRLNKQD